MLKVKNIYKKYSNEAYPLQGVSLEVLPKQTALIMGRSGSGKSTLINCICGIENKDSGEVYINNKLIDYTKTKEINNIRKHDIGIVFQQYHLLNKTTVYNQIALTCSASESDIDEILKELDIYELKHKLIDDCSGGQQQRVCIARALAKRPKLILADEPTANLDFSLAITSIKLMQKIANKIGSAVLIITHDDRILPLSDKVYHLEDGKVSIQKTNKKSIS